MHMCAWPVLRMVICLVINVGGTVALTAIWMTHGACTDGLIVISDICFGTMALWEGINLNQYSISYSDRRSFEDPRCVLFFFGLALRREFSPPPSARRNFQNKFLGTRVFK